MINRNTLLIKPHHFCYLGFLLQNQIEMEQSEDSTTSYASPFTIMVSALNHKPKNPSQFLMLHRAQKQQKKENKLIYTGECRICLEGAEGGRMIKPCKCTGTIEFTHEKCLQLWIQRLLQSHSEVQCQFCKTQYDYDCTMKKEVSCQQFALSWLNNRKEMLCFLGLYLLGLLFLTGLIFVLNMSNGPVRDKLIPSSTILLIYIAAMIISLVFMIILAAHFVTDFGMKMLLAIRVRNYLPSKYKFVRRTDLGNLQIRI